MQVLVETGACFASLLLFAIMCLFVCVAGGSLEVDVKDSRQTGYKTLRNSFRSLCHLDAREKKPFTAVNIIKSQKSMKCNCLMDVESSKLSRCKA